jgi:DegV family protein with EDD domain
MKSVGIITEDVASLPEETIKFFDIEIVKTKLFPPEWESAQNLYELMKKTKEVPKTSAPSPAGYLNAYKKVLKNYKEVLVITLSSKLSACYNSAFAARNLFEHPERIFLFDSEQAVAGQGLLVLKAKELIDKGKEVEEVLKDLETLKRKIKIFGYLKTTYWAEKQGRINKKLAFVFKMLKSFGIHPYFGIKKGKVGFSGFNFWKKDEIDAIVHQLKQEIKRGNIKIGINYTDNFKIALKLKERIENELKKEVLFLSLVPPIVGANSGPGTLVVGSLTL